jgi:hypothetical protein
LIDQVHHVLGRHRGDDCRVGWLSGLDAAQGEAHPTAGGLRIGKLLAERRAGEPIDERREWDRDGQYFHYLTKWMHALDQAARATGQPVFNRWARELAYAAHRAFTYRPGPGQRPRMYWKLSIDLSRPLVASMGQHDPLDGLITCVQLETNAGALEPRLADARQEFAAMVDRDRLATPDPLGLGGLLMDASRLAQLEAQEAASLGLIDPLLEAAAAGLRYYAGQPDLRAQAGERLAFRELGLAIGLGALERSGWPADAATRARLEALRRYLPLRTAIEAFWCDDAHRLAQSWLEHADINDVMLATSLEPEGFLGLQRAGNA